MIIYGLDISLARTGYVISEGLEIIEVGNIPTSDKLPTQIRLKQIFAALLKKKKLYKPDLVVIEDVFHRNAITSKQLYKAHGVCNLIFYDSKIEYINPSTIKKVVGGHGDASKEQVAEGVKQYFKDLCFSCDDESDAVGILVCWMKKNKLI